jgi:hypothetical protein
MYIARSMATTLVIAALTATSGCGSQTKSAQPARADAVATSKTASQSEDAASRAPLSRAQLIGRADAICRRVNLKRASIRLETRRDYAQLLPLATYERTALEQMQGLTPPAVMAASWKKILAGTLTAVDSIDAIAQAGLANERNEMERQSRIGGKALLKTYALAKHEGFRDCARS